MKRLLATFALAILAGTAVAASVETIIIRDGEHAYADGDATDYSFGKRFASFELDGVRYVITDADALEEIEEVVEPQIELGKKQAALGAKQAKLGAEQAALGARQARARDDEARELAAEQRKLGDRQRELGDRQRELGELQRKAGKQVEEELEKVFRNAVRSGVARRR
jgi:hypothetical protein